MNVSMHRKRLALAACLGMLLPSYLTAADIVVTNALDTGAGSLRNAIQNAAAGDRIVFDIPGGPTIIPLGSALPEITDNLTFINRNVAPVIIDRGAFGPISVTGGIIDLGRLQVTGAGPDIVLSPAATLIGNMQQVTADITTSGTIAPGTTNASGNVGRLIINGELDATGSNIELDLRGGTPASNDRIDATGQVTVTNATLNPNFVGSAYAVGDVYTVIHSDNGLTGPLANAADTFDLPSNPFLEATINTTLDEVQILIQDNGLSFSSFVEGCNQTASANELDRLRVSGNAAQTGVIADLRNGSTDRVNQAVGQLSGTIYPSLVAGEINQIQNSLHSIRDRVLLQRDDLIDSGHWSPWVRGYGMSLRADADDCLTEGYRQEVGGVEIGTGFVGPSGLGVHGFVQLGSADTSLRGADQSAESESYRFGGAVQYLWEYLYVLGVGGFGVQDHSVERSLSAFTDGALALSNLDGTNRFASAELGTMHGSDDALWMSFVSVQGIGVDLDAGAEAGPSAFDLLVNDIEGESLRSMVGGALARTNATALGPATTRVRLGWLHEFLDQQQTAQTAVESATPVFYNVQSAQAGRDWLSVGAQLDWGFILGGQFTLAYQGNVNSQSAFQSGLIGTRWNW